MSSEDITETWVRLSQAGDYPAILRTACERYLLSEKVGDAADRDACLSVIVTTAEHLLSTSRSGQTQSDPAQLALSCSFCGRTEDDARLGAGPDAFICEFCVADFSAIFADRGDTKP